MSRRSLPASSAWRAPALLGLALCVLSLCGVARADQIEYSSYYFGDNNKNTVATTAFSLAKTLWQKTTIMLDVELDQTTVPPLDAVTGASRPARQIKSDFKKNRGQIIGGVEQGLGGNTKIMGSYYFSQEVDYQSQSFVGGITQDFFQKNLTVSLRAQYTLDSVGEILPNGELYNRFKETHQASLTFAQILSCSTLLRFGGDEMRNHGFLSDPYRKVAIADAASPAGEDTVAERHPGMRYRQALWAELSQYLTGVEASIVVNYRYYWDDWDVTSHTLSFKLNKYVTRDWIFSPEYRYYQQTGADFGDYGKSAPGSYDAIDYKLTPFTSNTVGATVTCFLRAFSRNHSDWDFLNNSSVSVDYFRYFNDTAPNNFSANVVEGSMKFTF